MSIAPEAIEHAIELVNGLQPIARAASAECTLESLGIDNIDRITLAMEIEDRWNARVSEDELLGWLTITDLARTISRLSRDIAA